MSLVGNLWKRFRSSPAQVKRARRLFMEPLEDRNLLAAQLTVTKTDSFTSQMPPQSVRAGETIGLEGRTGNATGCHLHYSLYLANGPWVQVAPLLVEKWHYPTLMRLRIDPLLRDFPAAAKRMASWNYSVEPEPSTKTIEEARRFLREWIDRQKRLRWCRSC